MCHRRFNAAPAPCLLQTPKLSLGFARSDLAADTVIAGVSAYNVSVVIPALPVGDDQVLDTHVIVWSDNPNADTADTADTAGAPTAVVTLVTSVELVDAASGATVALNGYSIDGSSVGVGLDRRLQSQLPPAMAPVALTMPVGVHDSFIDFRCSYWSVEASAWQSDGVVLLGFTVDDAGNVAAHCGTLHLTDFSAVRRHAEFLTINTIHPFSDAGAITSLFQPKNTWAVAIVFGVVGVSLVSLVHGLWAERAMVVSRRQLYEVHMKRFGEVRYGLAYQSLHTPGDHPVRARLRKLFLGLQVGVIPQHHELPVGEQSPSSPCLALEASI